jgi:hypothetical protein
MPGILSAHDLLAELRKQAAILGLTVRDGGALELAGGAESIRAKWWLGGRKVTYRMSCRLAEGERTLHFREAVVERSWGIPPPTLTVEKTTVSGWKRSGERTDVSLGGGGGKLDYARMRAAVERAAVAAGWTFHLEGGRMP